MSKCVWCGECENENKHCSECEWNQHLHPGTKRFTENYFDPIEL